MAYTFLPFSGSEGDFLGSALGTASTIANIVKQFQAPAPYEPPSTSVFDIPGYDLQWPVRSEATTGKMDTCAALSSPFRGAVGPTSARPQPHVVANPTTGKAQWFVPARITGWKMTHVRRPRRRCACRKR
jgi:hypothetical protein